MNAEKKAEPIPLMSAFNIGDIQIEKLIEKEGLFDDYDDYANPPKVDIAEMHGVRSPLMQRATMAGSVYNHQFRVDNSTGNSKAIIDMLITHIARKVKNDKLCPCCGRKDVLSTHPD